MLNKKRNNETYQVMAKVVFKSYNQNDNLLFPPCLGNFIAENGPGEVLNYMEELAFLY